MTDYSKQEEQWEKRMAVIGQNGNTGEHYPPPTGVCPPSTDSINHPQHYTDGLLGCEAIGIIASSMTKTEFKGYCLGNILKYRLRAGKKGDAQECLQKADKYNDLYEQYKSLCHRDV